MRVLLIGASGAIGTHLTRQLAEQGHHVTGTSRSAAKASQLLKTPPASARDTFAAMSHLDDAVLAAGGIALRYGGFYGEGDQMVAAVRRRQYPLVGDGAGIMPFIHLHDAAAATVLALTAEGPAVYNVTDDDPAPMRDWLPALAAAVGAKPPRRYPSWREGFQASFGD